MWVRVRALLLHTPGRVGAPTGAARTMMGGVVVLCGLPGVVGHCSQHLLILQAAACTLGAAALGRWRWL